MVQAGYFGPYGGRYLAETLRQPVQEIEAAWEAARADPQFHYQLAQLLQHYAGRPSPLYHAARLSQALGGAQVWFKREDLNHTGSHKINNCLGQVLLAQRLGKHRVIAETGAGQHGVAMATACALMGLQCVVYMGSDDIARQHANVQRMQLLGAKLVAVDDGSRTLRDAMNAALRDWAENYPDTYYAIGTAAGPHPYPSMVRELQAVIGRESRQQVLDHCGRLPHTVVACVGGGSNAIGVFSGFMQDAEVQLLGVEAAGKGLHGYEHAAALSCGQPGILHGNLSYYLQDEQGQIRDAYSVSAGLDYPGVGPEHAWLHDTGRARYSAVTDKQALAAFRQCALLEGILPALEAAHALAAVQALAPSLGGDDIILMNLCGRGDKDVALVASLQAEAEA